MVNLGQPEPEPSGVGRGGPDSDIKFTRLNIMVNLSEPKVEEQKNEIL